MKNKFVETSNVKRFQAALSALEARGAGEACLVVIDGAPGVGKTTTLKHWVAQTGSIYLRAKKKWTPNWFLGELLETVQIHPPHGFKKMFGKALDELSMRHMSATMERRPFGLVIDEADHFSSDREILESIRDLSDNLEMPTILVGMGKVNDHLTRFPQVARRVSQKVHFEGATLADVRALISERCEVKVADDLCEFVLKVSRGFNSEILEAIANIERFGLRFEPDADGITMADMAGQVIIKDRRSLQSILVPVAL